MLLIVAVESEIFQNYEKKSNLNINECVHMCVFSITYSGFGHAFLHRVLKISVKCLLHGFSPCKHS